MLRLFSLFFILLLFSCDKPDPNPELKDPIYQDLKAQLDIATKNIAEAEKKLKEFQAEMDKAKPQSGQIKYASKRYWEMRALLDKYLQQQKYWTIRIKERELFARKEYLQAFKSNKSWPNPQEYQDYSAEQRLRTAKKEWDVKQRLETYKKSMPSASGTAGEPGAAAPAAH